MAFYSSCCQWPLAFWRDFGGIPFFVTLEENGCILLKKFQELKLKELQN